METTQNSEWVVMTILVVQAVFLLSFPLHFARRLSFVIALRDDRDLARFCHKVFVSFVQDYLRKSQLTQLCACAVLL